MKKCDKAESSSSYITRAKIKLTKVCQQTPFFSGIKIVSQKRLKLTPTYPFTSLACDLSEKPARVSRVVTFVKTKHFGMLNDTCADRSQR